MPTADSRHSKELPKAAVASGEALEREVLDRRLAAEETAGALSGVYEPGELEGLREDWPEGLSSTRTS